MPPRRIWPARWRRINRRRGGERLPVFRFLANISRKHAPGLLKTALRRRPGKAKERGNRRMEKLLASVMPVGAPWGGPESVRFTSCFASLYTYLEQLDGSMPRYCDQGPGLCTHCGRCGTFEPQNKAHEQLYHLFLGWSGLSCYTVWRPDFANRYLTDLPLVLPDDRYIRRTMELAGYTWELLDSADEGLMRRRIVQSIDGGSPVMAYRLMGGDWCLITGYDGAGETLYGLYQPQAWDAPETVPEPVGNGLFCLTGWYRPGIRLLIITGKGESRADGREQAAYLARVLRDPGAQDCVSGRAAYSACLAQLRDERFAGEAETGRFLRFYVHVHRFFGLLAEGRCFAAFACWPGFFGRIRDPELLPAYQRAGDAFMAIHNACWQGWAAMGQNHLCEPERHLAAFRRPEVRGAVAEIVEELRRLDETAMAALLSVGEAG